MSLDCEARGASDISALILSLQTTAHMYLESRRSCSHVQHPGLRKVEIRRAFETYQERCWWLPRLQHQRSPNIPAAAAKTCTHLSTRNAVPSEATIETTKTPKSKNLDPLSHKTTLQQLKPATTNSIQQWQQPLQSTHRAAETMNLRLEKTKPLTLVT